ncbi:SAG family member [Eimeria maxima]|uniref:SAG family member n=1 Tax=Eimeria maxima TaxID=5804 RepID=U6M1J7_EIMMA|nr:SAG family member [Eimeria maxima]CDJ56968.1 SAG family member [Eimeria maxima]
MAGLKFLSLAVAAVSLLVNYAQAQLTNSAKSVDCSAAMNDARKRGGFVNLQVPENSEQQLPITTTTTQKPTSVASGPNDTYITKVCTAMKNSTPISAATTPDGTFAYAVQTGEEADCKAAVDEWKKAYSNFDSLPPAFTDYATAPYKDANNVSLISLFNPKEEPTVDCAYFKCLNQEGNAIELKALLCVTTPNALKAKAQPYTEDEWKRINTAINSGSAAVPTVIVVGAAALAALFL